MLDEEADLLDARGVAIDLRDAPARAQRRLPSMITATWNRPDVGPGRSSTAGVACATR